MWHGFGVRRLLKHAAAGLGASVVVAVAGVSALGSPVSADVTVAVPVAVATLPGAAVEIGTAGPDAVAADRDHRSDRETRETERVRMVAAASQAASRRATTLSAQGQAMVKQGAAMEAARAKAKAEAEAEAKAVRVAKAAAKAKADAARAKTRAAAKAKAGKAAAKARQASTKQRSHAAGVSDPREIARQILKNTYSYGPEQYACFNYIIMRESDWSVTATNAISGAYGIPQALPGSKMATIAADWRTNPATQITWGIEYMKKRYGSPCEAKVFKASHGWY